MQVRSLLVAAGLALTTANCGSDSPSEPRPRTPLECEVNEYPCSLSDVSLAVLERGDALGDEALAMLESGASTADAAAFLGSQADMAEVEWDDTAIWFRLTDGAGIWLLREGAFSPETGAGVRPADVPARPRPPLPHVVGGDSDIKKALVLSPFHWQVPELDDTPRVAEILAATRGYEGWVTYQSNDEETATEVTLDSFRHWDDYEVIHISTHGGRVCTDAGCRATIVAGTLASALPGGPGTKAEKLQALDEEGVSYAKSERTGREYLVLNADFFRRQYPTGIEDALIYLNACQSSGPEATDVVDAIQGSTSVVFGWTESVYVVDATATAESLYTAMGQGGYPAKVALTDLGDRRFGRAVEDEPAPELWLSERPLGGDLRMREVVQLLHPSSGTRLTPSDFVHIEGTPGDGEPDAVPFVVQVDGVKPILAQGMMVHVEIDGEETEPVALTSVEQNEHDEWVISGTLVLPYDLTVDREVVFRTWTNLHSGGESRHGTQATLAGEEPIMGLVWEMEAVHTEGWFDGTPHTPYGSTTRLTLRFSPGQSATEPHPEYVITGGTVTFDYNHTYFDCTTTAPVLTFDITADVSRDSRLLFDTTTDPVEYSGVLFTYGPEFTVTTTCGGGDPDTRTHRATTTWLLVEAEERRTVSADRRRIEGTYRVEASVGAYVETHYVITRLQ